MSRPLAAPLVAAAIVSAALGPLAAAAGPDAPVAGSPSAPGAIPDDGADCLIEPMTTTELGSSTRGVVARVLVERGEPVIRGQALVELDADVERAFFEQAEARADMRSEILAREAELVLTELEFARVEQLHGQDLVPDRQREEARARHRVAEAALVQALENRRLVQLELLRMRRELERRTLRSPVDAVVVERLVEDGELVADNPVLRLAELDPLRVEAVLPGRLFGTLAPGDVARLYPELGNGAMLEARIDTVDPVLDARSGTFAVRLRLDNADLSIPAGQRCRVAFDAPTAIPIADVDAVLVGPGPGQP